MNNIYKKIIEHYGEETQINKTVEELAELIVAIKKDNKKMIAEEIADVEIMLEQIRTIYNIKYDIHKINSNSNIIRNVILCCCELIESLEVFDIRDIDKYEINETISCIYQLKLIYEINNEVDEWKERKLRRMKERMKKER